MPGCNCGNQSQLFPGNMVPACPYSRTMAFRAGNFRQSREAGTSEQVISGDRAVKIQAGLCLKRRWAGCGQVDHPAPGLPLLQFFETVGT